MHYLYHEEFLQIYYQHFRGFFWNHFSAFHFRKFFALFPAIFYNFWSFLSVKVREFSPIFEFGHLVLGAKRCRLWESQFCCKLFRSLTAAGDNAPWKVLVWRESYRLPLLRTFPPRIHPESNNPCSYILLSENLFGCKPIKKIKKQTSENDQN